MIKKSLLSILTVCFSFLLVQAQIQNPVQWEYSSKKIADKTYEVHMVAKIDKGWHLYAQEAGEGPVPTSFLFSKNPILSTQGKTKEVGKLIKEYDENFASELKFFADKVDFVQIVKLKANAKTVLKGEIEYMVCNDQKCLPPKKLPFTIKVG